MPCVIVDVNKYNVCVIYCKLVSANFIYLDKPGGFVILLE